MFTGTQDFSSNCWTTYLSTRCLADSMCDYSVHHSGLDIIPVLVWKAVQYWDVSVRAITLPLDRLDL